MHLYCAVDGRGHEDRAIVRQEDYRQEGESVLIVHGTLKTGPWKCDKCNSRLRRGDAATLMTAFPRFMTEAMDAYDFAGERRYLDLEKAAMTLYGAPWPGGAPAAMLRRRSESPA
jgi:hypothetical protein